MTEYLLRGILIGLLFGLPVGAVGTLTVQRTFRSGTKAGLLTGLGSSVADCVYACAGAFGMTFLSDFLLKHQTVINVLGGSFILFMGIRLLLRKNEADRHEGEAIGFAKMFFSSFAVGITNPTAVLTFLFAFSYFGISGTAGLLQEILLVCGVFVGTYIWWGILTALSNLIKKKTTRWSFRRMDLLFRSVLCLFAANVFLQMV